MALSKDIYGSVGVPRVYIDYHSFADAMGYTKEYYGYQVDSKADKGFAFGLNPSRTIEYTIDTAESDSQTITFAARYKNWNDSTTNLPDSNPQFSRFMGTANYFGLLGHNLASLSSPSVDHIRMRMYNYILGDLKDPDTSDTDMVVSSIVGDTHNLGNELGYSLYEIETPFDIDVCGSVSAWIWFDSAPVPQWSTFNLGSFTFGRYLDLPRANLSVNTTQSYSGITQQRTIGGDLITNINHHQSPNWGDLAPFTHIDTTNYNSVEEAMQSEDYRAVRRGGRRVYDLSFSFISKENMFPKNFEGNMSGDYEYGDGGWTWDQDDNIVGTWLNYSLGGRLRFLFQPDNTKQDFFIAHIKDKSIKITQQAPELYGFKCTIEEVW